MPIIVRPFEEKDLPAIQAMHKSMDLGYEPPDWGNMVVSCVIERDEEITMATFLRPTAETFLLMNEGRKRDQLADLLITHREMVAPMKRNGLTDTHAWLPPVVDRDFGKLLKNIGWKQQLWNSYCFEVK